MIFTHKYYLNGMDWVNSALHYQCRKTPTCGNNFLIALELQGVVSKLDAEQMLKSLESLRPILNSSRTRQWFHLAPYWKIGKSLSLPEFSYCMVPTEIELIEQCEIFVNQQFCKKNEHLAINFIVADNKTLVLFKFDHRLFDGRGGEILLNKINNAWQIDGHVECLEPDCTSPQLTNWGPKFDSGKRVNQWLRDLKKTGVPVTFTEDNSSATAKNSFKLLSFSVDESREIFRRAEETLGPYMNTPYLAAAVCSVLGKLGKDRGYSDKEKIMLPMTVDLRDSRNGHETLFFNQWSLAPFVSSIAETADFKTLAEDFKRQFINFSRSGFMQDIRNANLLTRIMPLPFFSRMSAGIFAGTAGSCSYAFIPESSFKASTFLGKPVKRLLHLPLMPPAPGVGVFMTVYNEQLTITISYRNGVVSKDDVESLIYSFKKLL
jgi:hypothetical protein